MTHDRCEGFQTGARDVIEGVLFGQAPARGLAVSAQGQRFWILGIELFDEFGPQQAGGPQLGDFHEVVHANGPEE